MNELPKTILGQTAWERAVNLAGLLAERGVQQVVLETAAGRRELNARSTDLPHEIMAMIGSGGGTLSAAPGGLRFEIRADTIARVG
jgi:hypothetical protein